MRTADLGRTAEGSEYTVIDFIVKYWLEVAFGLIVACLTALYRKLSKQMKEQKAKQEAMDAGVRALLRDRIVGAYNHYAVDRGYCPIYAKENVNQMYEAYHTLGGNGTVTKLKEQIDELPTEPGTDHPKRGEEWY